MGQVNSSARDEGANFKTITIAKTRKNATTHLFMGSPRRSECVEK
jgi:hypothetical protein